MPKTKFLSLCFSLLSWTGVAAALSLTLPGIVGAQSDRPLEHAIVAAFGARELDGLHAVLVIRNGETLAEVYFPGADALQGRPLGVVAHGPDTLHDVRSISKSVTALLYGIALADVLVPDPDALLLAQLPEYIDLAGNGRRDEITVGDALAMRMGTKWNESLPYSDPQNSQIAMEMSADPIRYALSREMATKPGTHWSYNGGAAEIIGRLIEDGTGMALDEYARIKLFDPLGISRWEWSSRPDGAPSAASGLRMTARDLAKIGQLVLDNGEYGGKQIVPRAWLDELFVPRSQLDGIRYGYFWWLADAKNPRAWVSGLGNETPEAAGEPAWMAGLGNGGQRLSIQPDIGLVVVIFAGDYGNPDDWAMPVRLIEEYVAASLRP